MVTIKTVDCFDKLRAEHAATHITPLTMQGRLRLELRSARFNWVNARYMLVLSNRGQVNKGQAFAIYNRARAQYKRTIKMVAQVLALPKHNDGSGTWKLT